MRHIPKTCLGGLRPPTLKAASRVTRGVASLPRMFPPEPLLPYTRAASTSSANTDWVAWVKKASLFRTGTAEDGGKALLFAGLGSYPHTPYSPTPSSLQLWEEASEALLNPDATLGYWPKGMEEFAGTIRSGRGIRGWMRGWVEGRSLDELMARADVTAAFILTSSIAILASAQEYSGSATLLPYRTTHLAGHGFIGTLTALVASGRLDLSSGVRLAMMWASLPPSPPSSNIRATKFVTTILSAKQFHSLSSPSFDIPDMIAYYSDSPGGSDSPASRKRAMQLILDEVHAMQKDWNEYEDEDWAAAGLINSSKVLGVTGNQEGVWRVIDRLQQLGLANPVMDVRMPCPYNTELMAHAIPKLRELLEKCMFREPPANSPAGNSLNPIILDPISTYPLERYGSALLSQLTNQLRWHKTLSRLYVPLVPSVTSFHTVGRGARGLGIMLRGEIKRRPPGSREIEVSEFGVKQEDTSPVKRRAFA